MSITKETAKHVAWLARIGLSEDEAEVYARRLGGILEYIARLEELDTEGAEPAFFVPGEQCAYRDDEPGWCLSPEEVLANAPDTAHGFFRVPKIIRSETPDEGYEVDADFSGLPCEDKAGGGKS